MCNCEEQCCGGHHRGAGILIVVLGLLMLINLNLWPKWTGVDGWMSFVAVILLVYGVAKIIDPVKHEKKEASKAETPVVAAPPVEAPTVTATVPLKKASAKKKR